MIPINVETRLHHFYFNYTIEDDLYEQLSNELMARVEDIWKNGQDEETSESYEELTKLGIDIIKRYLTEKESLNKK